MKEEGILCGTWYLFDSERIGYFAHTFVRCVREAALMVS